MQLAGNEGPPLPLPRNPFGYTQYIIIYVIPNRDPVHTSVAGLSISNIVFFFFFFSVFYASTAPAHRASGRPAQTARARFGFTRRLSSVVAREVQVGAALQRRRGGAARHRGHRVVPVQVIGTWTGREVDINGGGEELGEDHCTGRF